MPEDNIVPISSRIEELLVDHRDLVEFLEARGQLRLRSRAQEALAKTLIVASASHLEVEMTKVIIDLYRETTQGAEPLAQFVAKKAIGKGFAQLFDWGDERGSPSTAKHFYALFGPSFSRYMQSRVKDDKKLDDSVKAFLEIGNRRNRMVHGDYADFQLDKTVEEAYVLYSTAIHFVREFSPVVREFMSRRESTSTS